MDTGMLLPAALVFLAVAMATVALVLGAEMLSTSRRRRDVLQRLDREVVAARAEDTGFLRAGDESLPSSLESAASRLPRFRDAGRILEQAGLPWSTHSFLVASAGLAMAVGLATLMVTQSLLIAAAGAVAGSLGPDIFVRWKRTQRIKKFEEQFADTVDLLGRAIRAGHPLSYAIRTVAEEAPDPAATEFRRIFEQQRFGLPFEEALLGMSDRVDLVDVRIFVTAVLVQREVGGNLAEILDKIAQTVRARFSILRQLRTYTAQGRLTGYVVGLMPVTLGLLLYFLNRDYVMELVTTSMGRLLAIGAVTMQVMGYLWIRRIVKIEI
jgi:tight adherence protein B